MGNCKDCRHWDELFSICVGVDWIDVFEDDVKPMDKANGFAIAVCAPDDQGLTIHLKTGPLFGCVQFQPALREGV